MDVKLIKKFVKKRINSKKKKKRVIPRYTDEQMFEALRRVGGGARISENEYTRKRTSGDPTAACYYVRFGSFKVIAEMVFGPPPKDLKKDFDEVYMVKLINDFGIKTSKQYKQKAKEEPDIFPTEYMVFKFFKNYGNLFEAAKKWGLEQQLILCLNEKIRLKKSPTIEDYKMAGINVKMLLNKYVTLSNLNRMVRQLEEAYEISRRNKCETKSDDKEAIKREKEKVFKPFSEQLHL